MSEELKDELVATLKRSLTVRPKRRNVATARRLAHQALDRWVDAMRDDMNAVVEVEHDEVCRLAASAAHEESTREGR